jgi:dephospho-CoA kinase
MTPPSPQPAPPRGAGAKPIIGIAGGIGSGKSFVADLFGELACLVIKSDEQVYRAYQREDVKAQLRAWWGDRAFTPAGDVDRRAVARIVFDTPSERIRLEGLIHPLVNAERRQLMLREAGNPAIRAFVWDTPLLFETGLNRECDCIVFVDAPLEVRLRRVSARGWTADDLTARENLQLPLDKKRRISDYCVSNIDGIDVVREQVRDILTRILARV